MYKVHKNADNVKDCCKRARTAKQAGIAEGTTVAAASVGKRTQSVCASLCIVTLGSVWEKPVGPCVTVLCVDVDMVHGCCKTGRALFCTKQVCCRRTGL